MSKEITFTCDICGKKSNNEHFLDTMVLDLDLTNWVAQRERWADSDICNPCLQRLKEIISKFFEKPEEFPAYGFPTCDLCQEEYDPRKNHHCPKNNFADPRVDWFDLSN